MVKPNRPPANGFVRAVRNVYNPLGFSKGYNFVLFFIAVGYLFGFTLSRLEYLSYNGIFCNPNGAPGVGAAPGECFYYLQDPFKLGMKLHLYTILPASLLACLQFVPAIRHKLILFHRLNGYTVIVMSTVASAGAIMISKHAFGGDFVTQGYAGMLVILTTLGYVMALVNIKLLQIDQHRAWMMRTWSWFATIITIRIIQIISVQIISPTRDWYNVRPCAQIESVLGQSGTLAYYPGCAAYFDGTKPDQRVVVTADFGSNDPTEIASALAIPFGTAGWIALVLHTIAIEFYLRLTPAESDRLRNVSYERQLAKGFKRPGCAGLVAERFGDAPPYAPPKATTTADHEYVPLSKVHQDEEADIGAGRL